jgi:nucleotide-binding universal stress UspA family protein
MIKRILVGLGSTPFAAIATQRAIELAQRHRATLTGVTIVDPERLAHVGPVPSGARDAVQKFREPRIKVTQEQVEASVKMFESACADGGVNYTVRRETGASFDLIISRARYNDLMIFGLRGLFDYGAVDEPRDALTRLITEGVRPIIAVSQRFREIRRVLIAYSGSMESAKAMKRFTQLRLWPNVTLKIVHYGKDTDEAKQLLTDAAHYCRSHGFETEVQHFTGSVREQLLKHAAEWQTDLIVMGNSARRVLIHHVIGNTTLHVIRNADLPLFLSQ